MSFIPMTTAECLKEDLTRYAKEKYDSFCTDETNREIFIYEPLLEMLQNGQADEAWKLIAEVSLFTDHVIQYRYVSITELNICAISCDSFTIFDLNDKSFIVENGKCRENDGDNAEDLYKEVNDEAYEKDPFRKLGSF